jgi:FkbM family methyltransferase
MYFDIGSNIGNWSLANVNGCDKIISIEASPFTFQKLVNNCKNDKIILLNYAVCNNNGKDIKFYQAYCDTISTINKDWLTSKNSRFYNEPYSEITCKTIGIDNLIEQYGIPDLIKIDVEGGEYESIVSLTQKAKLICFEWASELNDITIKCIDHLFHLGYTRFYIQNEDNYLFRPRDDDFYDIYTTKIKLSLTIPKQDWGMIWCN